MTGTSWTGELPLPQDTSVTFRFELCTNGQCDAARLTLDGTSPSAASALLGARPMTCLAEPSLTELALACEFAQPPPSPGDVYRITITSGMRCWSAEWRSQ